MESARDDVFCLEIARRAVARASLRLGIKAMTEECLDVLGDVLLSYLQRLGKTLSHLVEAGGRTSAHTNVLDALIAIELCTSPAVQRMHMRNSNEENNSELFAAAAAAAAAVDSSATSSSNANSQQQSSFSNTWQGLADFCFGPDWHREPTDPPERTVSSQRGGKEGPSLTNDTTEKKGGWSAPFPHEVPHFPQSSWGDDNNNLNNGASLTAKPHNLPLEVALSLHATAEERQQGQKQQQQQQRQQQQQQQPPQSQSQPQPQPQPHLTQQPQQSQQQLMQHEERLLQQLPDEVFTASTTSQWGCIGNTNKTDMETTNGASSFKRKHNQILEEAKTDQAGAASGVVSAAASVAGSVATESPAKKKVKLDLEGTSVAGSTATTAAVNSTSKPTSENNNDPNNNTNTYNYPLYVPNFYPKPPRARKTLSGRTVLDIQPDNQVLQNHHRHQYQASSSAASSNIDVAFGLRSALVQLDEDYWGSGWDGPNLEEKETQLRVPLGRTEQQKGASTTGSIVPLGRASGCRVSKILEGSIDAATMQ